MAFLSEDINDEQIDDYLNHIEVDIGICLEGICTSTAGFVLVIVTSMLVGIHAVANKNLFWIF